MAETSQLSLLAKLDLIPGQLGLVATALYAALTGPFRGDWAPKSYIGHITRAVVRKLPERFSDAQLQYQYPPTVDAYKAFCKLKAIEPIIVDLREGAKGLWFGNSKAKEIVVYFHGGGFALPASGLHYQVYQSAVDSLKTAGKDIGVLFISYTLTPHAIYPEQLKQAVEGIRYILGSHSPSDIILGGDSAGGNLAISLISHISHPHAAIAPLEVKEPFRGLLLMSPWTTFRNDWPSSNANAYKDILSIGTLERWSDAYLGAGGKKNNQLDYYMDAATAPESWWEGAKVRDTLVIAGEEEILRDGILEWADKWKKGGNVNTTVVVGQGEAHDCVIYTPMVMDLPPDGTGTVMDSWLKARL